MMKIFAAFLIKDTFSFETNLFSDFTSFEENRGRHVLSLLQKMIQVTNSTHDPESFLEYGCWCASNPNARKHDLTKGRSSPVDEIDSVCRSTAYCHMCLKIDHEQECDFYQEYNHTISENGLECHDAEGTCGWAACQCDAKFIEDMGEVESLWRPQHNIRGGFDFESRCLQPRKLTVPYDKCCGYKPDRYPFKSFDGRRSCCGSQIFDTTYLKCCEMSSYDEISQSNNTAHGTTLQSNECSLLAESQNYEYGQEVNFEYRR